MVHNYKKVLVGLGRGVLIVAIMFFTNNNGFANLLPSDKINAEGYLRKDFTKEANNSLKEVTTSNNIRLVRVEKWEDGTSMIDSRVDDVVYFKNGNSFYKRDFEGPVMANWFGAVGDGLTDDTEALQKMLNSQYKYISLEKGKTYLVSKNIKLKGFPNNDQPCLLIDDKHEFVFDGSDSKLVVREHAQGILEIQRSSNGLVKNLFVLGSGNFPPIDGETGYSEKGIEGKGYYTSGFWGYYKNNSKNTAEEYRGGFGNKFRQYANSKTSDKWGKWNGGYIGNVSYGILIHNACSNIVLDNCQAEKFNYVGMGVGHNGDSYPIDLKFSASSNITFRNCKSNYNYSAGFHSMDVDGFILTDCTASYSGHPNASIRHETSNPGYGYTARGSKRFTNNALIENSVFAHNRRKGLDVHAGVSITFRDNDVTNSNICGIYAAWSSDDQPAKYIRIIGNEISNCGRGNGSLGAIYIGANATRTTTSRSINAIVEKNRIFSYSGSAIRVRYGNTVRISGNVIENSLKGEGPNLSAILVVGRDVGERIHSVEVLDNKIIEENGYILRGIQASNTRNINIESNQINFKADADNLIIIRNSKNVFINGNDMKLDAKGTYESIPKESKQFKRNIPKFKNVHRR